MSGRDYKLFISSDGTSTGVKTEVEFQGDSTVNLGKTLSTTSYKNGALTAQGYDGFKASLTLGQPEPLPAGQVLMWNAFDNGGSAYIWIETANSGGLSWEGPVKLGVTEITHPVNGEPAISVEIAEDGNIVRSTNP